MEALILLLVENYSITCVLRETLLGMLFGQLLGISTLCSVLMINGGLPISRTVSHDFISCLSDCKLFDLEVRGPGFTWENQGIAERLDRAFINLAWKTQFPNSFINHLARVESSYCLIMAYASFSNPGKPRPLRFQSAWLLDYCSTNIVSQRSKSLADQNLPEFGNIFKRKFELSSVLEVPKRHLILTLTVSCGILKLSFFRSWILLFSRRRCFGRKNAKISGLSWVIRILLTFMLATKLNKGDAVSYL